jgi:beta-phosphoglucomutase
MLHYLKKTDCFGISQQNARPILEKTGIRHYFDAIVDGNDVTNAKPDPVFLIAAKLLDVNPENAIVLKIL